MLSKVEVNLRLDNVPHVDCQVNTQLSTRAFLDFEARFRPPFRRVLLHLVNPDWHLSSLQSSPHSQQLPFDADRTIMNRITSTSLANGSDLELLRRVWEDLEHKTTGFVALDTEFQGNGNVVELGFAIRQLTSPGNGYAQAPITTRNIIVENARPPRKPFSFGRSETIRYQQDLHHILLDIFRDLQAKNVKVVLVGHDIAGDLDRLQRACGWVKPSAVTLLDTQKIWRALHDTIEKGTLRLSLESYNVNFKSTELHNAGNDAYYTLKLLFCKAEHAQNRHPSPVHNRHASPAQVPQLLPRRPRAVPDQRVAEIGPLRLDRGSSPYGTHSSPLSGPVPALKLEKMTREPVGYSREPAGHSGGRAGYSGDRAGYLRGPAEYSRASRYSGGPVDYAQEYAAPSLKRKRASSEEAMEQTGSERLMKRSKRSEVIDLTADTPPPSPELEPRQAVKAEPPQYGIPGPFQAQNVIDLTNDASPSPVSSRTHSSQLGGGLGGDGHSGADGKEDSISDIIRDILH